MTGAAFLIWLAILFGGDALYLNPWWKLVGAVMLLFIFWLIGRRHCEYVGR
jgi:prepilin signal peptidase PulO-like enzyme (type II secretory pathway)